MIRTIVDSILPYLQALNFSDTVVGCVTTISRNVTGENNTKVVQRFPAYYNEDRKFCNNYTDYNDLVPNSKKKSIMYFEENGIQSSGVDGHYLYSRANIRLIFWCNIKNINPSLFNSDTFKLNVISAIPEILPNVNNVYSFIRATCIGEEKKDVAIFSRYTYSEEEKQYLLYPFDYFCLNYQIDFQVGKNCVEEPTLSPAIC